MAARPFPVARTQLAHQSGRRLQTRSAACRGTRHPTTNGYCILLVFIIDLNVFSLLKLTISARDILSNMPDYNHVDNHNIYRSIQNQKSKLLTFFFDR